MDKVLDSVNYLNNDNRLNKALELFNSQKWYMAHDLFEELWHEVKEPERNTLQGFLQVSVAELHLENNNLKGATILYGEGLGRLRKANVDDLGFDLVEFCNCLEMRLKLLQANANPDLYSVPRLVRKS